MVSCPKCGRSVPEKRSCIYCGTLLSTQPTALLGMNAREWVEEGVRVAELHQWDRAVSCFDKALQLDPHNSVAWYDKALVLADAQRLDDALVAALEAERLTPGDSEVRDLVLRLQSAPAAPLPEGRPGPAVVGDGSAADRYATMASSALHTRLRLFSGPAAIAARNWIVDVPRMSRWAATAHRGLLCHVLLGDRTAYVFRQREGDNAIDEAVLPQADLEAAGALLESGTLRRVVFCGNRPFALPVFAYVNEINERLSKLGVAADRHVELLVVEDG